MSDPALIQKTYTTILQYFVDHGRAPHYTELAELLGLSADEARQIQREAAQAAPAATCWLAHDTDYIESWGPFSNIPTHNRISVDGQQKWYGL